MSKSRVHQYSGYIILAAICWGMIGFFVKGLSALGLNAMEIVALRVMFSALILFLYGLFLKRNELTIKWKDLYLFVGTGILSIVFFNWAMFTSINMLSLSVSVILLYTAPAFVLVLSAIFLKETITPVKVILLCMTLLGCLLVTDITGAKAEDGKIIGYLIGLASGFGYALYSIFGKFAIRHYSSFTVSLYTFLIASAALIPTTQIWNRLNIMMNVKAILLIAGLCIVSTVCAFLLYTEGLKVVDSSKASILATVEPLTAMIIGIAVFQERLNAIQYVGGALIFICAIFASINKPLFFKKKSCKEETL